MTKRAGLQDLARAAGVSLATVDRALNGRERVRPETLRHIAEVAGAMGHPAMARLGAVPAAREILRLGVVLHKQGQDFYRAFADELHQGLAEIPGLRGRLVLDFATSQAPGDMAGQLRAMQGRCDVLAATAVDHPEVTAAVAHLAGAGLPVFSLLSDFAPEQRRGYLGLDNLKHGRMAAWMMGLTAREPGKVAIFVGGHRWHGHALRETGFRAHLREQAPHLTALEAMVNLETRALTYEATRALLARHADLRGIYVAGGGAEGAIAALREARRAEVALIVPVMTGEVRAGLAEGVVTMALDTPLARLCRSLFQTMARVIREPQAPVAPQVFLPPDIHFRETI